MLRSEIIWISKLAVDFGQHHIYLEVILPLNAEKSKAQVLLFNFNFPL